MATVEQTPYVDIGFCLECAYQHARDTEHHLEDAVKFSKGSPDRAKFQELLDQQRIVRKGVDRMRLKQLKDSGEETCIACEGAIGSNPGGNSCPGGVCELENPGNSEEESCPVCQLSNPGNDWKEKALGHLEDAVQVMGERSEVTPSRSARHALLNIIEQIDAIGADIKGIVNNPGNPGYDDERERLYAEVESTLPELAKALGGVKRAYIVGSWPTEKGVPSDIDIALMVEPRPGLEHSFETQEINGQDYIFFPDNAEGRQLFNEYKEEMKKRYGPSAEAIDISSLLSNPGNPKINKKRAKAVWKKICKKICPVELYIGESNPGNPIPEACAFKKEQIKAAKHFDPSSFRTLCPESPTGRCADLPAGKECATRVIIGCPKGKYDKKKDQCKVGTQGHVVYHGGVR